MARVEYPGATPGLAAYPNQISAQRDGEHPSLLRGGKHGETIREKVLQLEGMAGLPERICKTAALPMRELYA